MKRTLIATLVVLLMFGGAYQAQFEEVGIKRLPTSGSPKEICNRLSPISLSAN